MKTYQNALNLLGRILIVALFLPAGLSKITGFDGTVGYFTSLGMSAPTLGVIIAIIAEVAGGIALLVGCNDYWTCLLGCPCGCGIYRTTLVL